MPFALNPGDRRPVLAGAAVFLAVVVAGVLLAPASDADVPTSYSAASNGTKAAFLLLDTLGYQTRRWEQPPNELTDPHATTLIVADPVPVEQGERDAILRFVDAGGRLIVTGLSGAALAGLPGRPDPVAGLGWKPASAVTLSRITQAARVITLAPAARLASPVTGTPVYAVAGTPAVVHIRRSKGDIYWWASPTPLTNAGITATSNLPFVLASVGAPGERLVLFDEYFHGYRQTLAASLMHSPLKWMMAQLALVAALVLATYARRSGPVVPRVSETRLSPLEFVRTMGALYRRADGGAIAVGVAYASFRAALTARFGIRPSADPQIAAAAAGIRGEIDPAALVETMRACEAVRDQPNLRDAAALALVQAIHDRSTELGLNSPLKEIR
ncbi:MAG: DUF4350 domain-containing protein [Vicinamibacterales bacterium]